MHATMLAMSVIELPARLGQIFYFVVLPMLLLAGLGFLIQRLLGLDMPTLTRLNFYFVTPGMVFFFVVSSTVTAGEVGLVMGFTLGVMALVGVATMIAAWLLKVPRDRHNAMLMTTDLKPVFSHH